MSYNRKEFLRTSAALTAGFSLAGLPLISNADPMKAKKYGIQLYTVRNDIAKDLASTISYVAKAGYSQVELYGFDGKTFFGKTPKEFKAMFDASHLTSPSGHYSMPDSVVHGNLEAWKNIVEAASVMGNQYVTIPYTTDKYRNGDSLKKYVEAINKVAELTKKAGMKQAYHNHDFEFKKTDDGNQLLTTLLTQTDPGMVDFEFDLYWVVFAGENPLDWFQKFPGRFTMWHVKDMTINAQGQKESTQVGDGSIDFASIFAEKKLSGLKYSFVEQEAYTMPAEQCIKKSIAFLKKKKWGNS